MRRTFLVLMVVSVVLAATAAAQATFPETLPLPNGFQPEGISIGNGTTFYVGSIPTGAVYRGDLRTGTGAVLVPGDPVEPRSGSSSIVACSSWPVVRPARPSSTTRRGRKARRGVGRADREVQLPERADVRQRRRRHDDGCVLHGLPARGPLPAPARERRGSERDCADRAAHRRLPAGRRLQPQRHRCDTGRRERSSSCRARRESSSSSRRRAVSAARSISAAGRCRTAMACCSWAARSTSCRTA